MQKIRIHFPQVVVNARTVVLTDKQIEDCKNMSDNEKAEFIWSRMNQGEKDCTFGKAWMESMIETGVCGFKFL